MSRLILVDGRLKLEADDVPICSDSTAPVTVKSFSVSQVNSYGRCPRRWFFQKVRGIQVPEKPGMGRQLGSEIHHHIEKYLRVGDLPPVEYPHYKKIVAAVANLPKPGHDLLVENFFKVDDGGVRFTGVIDLVNLRKPGLVEVTDHKTTSRINDLEAKPVDVVNDPQMLTYAEWAFREYPDRTVAVAHNTISTKHVARTLPLNYVQIPRQRAADNWGSQLVQIKVMLALAAAPPADWNDVPGPLDPNACNDYGGCDFLAICMTKNPKIGVTEMDHNPEEASSLMARLKGLTGAATAAPAEPVALLPPDAPTRMTPQPEEAPEAPALPVETIGTKGKKSGAAEKLSPATKVFTYHTDRVLETTEKLESYLNEKGKQGWELVGFFDGIHAVFKRPA